MIAFNGTLDGKSGCWKVAPRAGSSPSHMTSREGWNARWIRKGNLILWTYDGRPAHFETSHHFKVYQETDLEEYRRLAFRVIWRKLRNRFYDPSLNGKDWEALRKMYEVGAGWQ